MHSIVRLYIYFLSRIHHLHHHNHQQQHKQHYTAVTLHKHFGAEASALEDDKKLACIFSVFNNSISGFSRARDSHVLETALV